MSSEQPNSKPQAAPQGAPYVGQVVCPRCSGKGHISALVNAVSPPFGAIGFGEGDRELCDERMRDAMWDEFLDNDE